jgi:hypothetical protein
MATDQKKALWVGLGAAQNRVHENVYWAILPDTLPDLVNLGHQIIWRISISSLCKHCVDLLQRPWAKKHLSPDPASNHS